MNLPDLNDIFAHFILNIFLGDLSRKRPLFLNKLFSMFNFWCPTGPHDVFFCFYFFYDGSVSIKWPEMRLEEKRSKSAFLFFTFQKPNSSAVSLPKIFFLEDFWPRFWTYAEKRLVAVPDLWTFRILFLVCAINIY